MSLLELQRNQLISLLKTTNASTSHVVTDSTTHGIFEKLLGRSEILSYCFTCYEIDDETRSKKRDRAVYILNPSQYTVDCLVAEYSKGKRYESAQLYFLPGLTREQSDKIRQSGFLMEAIDMTINKVQFLSLNPIERHTFTCGNAYSNKAYFNYDKIGTEVTSFQIQRAVASLLNLCILMNEYPIVRHYNSKLSTTIAQKFQNGLNDYYATNVHLTPNATKTIFFITDRSMDLFSPFCHLTLYRSVIFDLLGENNGLLGNREENINTFRYKSTALDNQGKEYKLLSLDYEDKLWTQFKNLEYSKVPEKLSKERAKTLEERGKVQSTQIHQLGHAFLHAEDVTLATEMVQGHLDLYKETTNEISRRKLADLIAIENSYSLRLAGKKDNESGGITDWLLNILNSDLIDEYDKIRLIAGYTFYRGGLVEDDLRKLILFSLSDPKKADSVPKLLKKFEHFGLKVVKTTPKEKPITSLSPYHGTRKNPQEATSEHVPAFAHIAFKLITNSLPEVYSKNEVPREHKLFNGNMLHSKNKHHEEEDDDSIVKDFPYLNGAPNEDDEDRDPAPTFNRSTSKFAVSTDSDANKPKVFMFIAGGVTHSELSAISSLENITNKNIYVGVDEVYSTWEFLGDIATIDDRRDPTLFYDLHHKKRPVPPFLAEVAAPVEAPVTSVTKSPSKFGHIHKKSDSHISSNSTSALVTSGSEKKHKKLFSKFKNLSM